MAAKKRSLVRPVSAAQPAEAARKKRRKRKAKAASRDDGSDGARGGQQPAAEAKAVGANWLRMKATLGAPARAKRRPRGPAPGAAAREQGPAQSAGRPQPLSAKAEATGTVALDCEMVGIGSGGAKSVIARVCVVNNFGNVLLDTHCRPAEKITDFRTAVSGVRPVDLKEAPPFSQVQKKVAKLLKGRIVVGHALNNDFRALDLKHPKRSVRDTARYAPLKLKVPGGRLRPRPLRELAAEHLGLEIQMGEHNPVDDARAALYLYHKHKSRWEQQVLQGTSKKGRKGGHSPDPPEEEAVALPGSATGYGVGFFTTE